MKSLATSVLTYGLTPGSTGNLLVDVANGAVSNLAVQGVLVATKLQSSIDWAGVAAAGVSAGVGGQFQGKEVTKSLGSAGAKVVGGLASSVGAAATYSLVSGQDFGDTILATLPSVIGQVAGQAIASGIGGREAGLFGPLGDLGGVGTAVMAPFNFVRDKIGFAGTAMHAVANTIGNLVADGISSAISDKETVDYLQREGGLSRAEARELLHDAKLSGVDQAGGGAGRNLDLQTRRARFDALEAKLVASGGAQDAKFLQFKRMYELSLLSGDVYLNKSDAYVTGRYSRLQGDAVSQATGGALTAADLVDARSGYFSAIYRNGETGELVYANRGTEIGQATDRATDILQAIGKSDPQYTRAMENARELKSHGVNVTFTGHSLGGGLATAQAIVSGYRAVVFNPASVHANTVGGASMLARQNSLVTNVTVNGEPLSRFQDGGKLTVGAALDAWNSEGSLFVNDHFQKLAAEVPSAGGRRMTLAPAYLARPRGAYLSIPGSPGHGITSVTDSLFYRYEQGW